MTHTAKERLVEIIESFEKEYMKALASASYQTDVMVATNALAQAILKEGFIHKDSVRMRER